MITKCRSCYSNKLTDILSLGDQYLSEFVEPGSPKPEKWPLSLVLCQNCTLLQLKDTTPPSKLYTDNYGYRSSISNTIRNDLKDVVDSVLTRIVPSQNDYWLSIGENDGTLLSYVHEPFLTIACDPVSKFAEDSKHHADIVISDYWSHEAWQQNVAKYQKARVITIISCFYDLPDPNKFVEDLVKVLDYDGIIVIQQNYLAGMITNHAFDNICHEHIEYYTLTSLEHLLNRHYLEVFDVETSDINGGSFRVYVRHMNPVEVMRRKEKKMRLDNKFTYALWGMQVNQIRKKLYEFIKGEVEAGKKVYCYAASTRGGTLLQACGLDNTLITAAVERNPEKWGKVMSGTGIPIISEEEARNNPPDYGLLLPYFFYKEIIERERETIKKGMKFIIPLPEFRIVGGDDI